MFTGAATWTDPAWRARAIGWATDRLAERGRRINGEVTQPHIRPWSTAMRIPTDGGVAWFKATGPGPAHEGPLLEVMRNHGARHVLYPIATDASRAWLLFDDGGPTLRQTRPDGRGDLDLRAWERILSEYAGLQRSLTAATPEMLDVGVPDARPQALVETLARLVADDGVWDRVGPDDRDETGAARLRLADLFPVAEGLAGELDDSGIEATVQHDDFHGGNILVGPDGDRFFDWGDGVVCHPFGTMTATLRSIAYHGDFAADGPEIGRLLDVYLEPWTDHASMPVLRNVAAAAQILGHVSRAAAWDRSMIGLRPEDMGGDHDATAGWLTELASALEARASGA